MGATASREGWSVIRIVYTANVHLGAPFPLLGEFGRTVRSGWHILIKSQQMGHASVQITLDRYSHLMKDSHPAQAARLSSPVFGAPTRANVVLKKVPRTPQNTVKDGKRPLTPIVA